MQKLFFLIILIIGINKISASGQTLKIGKLKYGGGGDWYANKTSLPNLITFCNQNLKTNFSTQVEIVEAGSKSIFALPFVHMTGHGNVYFNSQEAENLKTYLISGGFLHIDDNYGLDKHIRRELKKIFPEKELVEIPFNHPIYHQKYNFPKGLPKIHEHDKKPPQGYGIIHNGRLVVFYTFESDLGNGWEDAQIYNDPEPVRQQALQMGANLIAYSLSQF